MAETKNAVVVPIIASDFATVEKVLKFWRDRNPPVTGGDSVAALDLVYVLSGPENPAERGELEGIIDESGVRSMFAEVRVHFAGIPESSDYYIRDPRGLPPTDEGFIAGPNRVFFEIASSIGPRYDWCFLMELDCLPLRAGWGSAVRNEMERHSDAWVVGSRYHGWSWLGPELEQHLNGNALYRFGDKSFQAFLKEVWGPGMKTLLAWGYPGLAFDCFPSILSALAMGPMVSGSVREAAARGYGKFVETALLLNLSGGDDKRSKYGSLDSLLHTNAQTYFFHATWLMEELGIVKPELPEPAQVEKKVRLSTLDYSVKSAFAGKGAWVFGDLFAFRAKESAIVMQIIVDKSKVQAISVGCGEKELHFTAKRWSEKRTGGFGFVKFFASVLSIFGLRKRHGVSLRESLASWLLRLSSASRTDVIGAIRIWMRELRGRKIASGQGLINVSMDRLGKANGMTLVIQSKSEELVEGRVWIDVEKRH
ncbi:MAG: hypothetical protein P1U68_00205 [Verrucomicrobiales bacterium]|nr:hypothetical protein [Verrucomicrobiales bacterium]